MRTATVTPLIPSWVHTFDDYRCMFALTDGDLNRSILDYPAGISSFNVEMHQQNHDNVVSSDPHYNLTPIDMTKRVDEIIQKLATQLKQYAHRLRESDELSKENILNAWNQHAQLFLADYSAGQMSGRYRHADLPKLPFGHFEFELALCSDLVFRSEKNKSPEKTIVELCRVAHEVRVFPLLDEHGEVSGALGPTLLTLQQQNYGIEVREVPYRLQKGSNAMLRVFVKECAVYTARQ